MNTWYHSCRDHVCTSQEEMLGGGPSWGWWTFVRERGGDRVSPSIRVRKPGVLQPSGSHIV